MNRTHYTKTRSLKCRATVNGNLARTWMLDTTKYSAPMWDGLQEELAAAYARRAGHAGNLLMREDSRTA